jgi:hypothetical protein
LTPQNIEVLSENSLSRLSGTTPSTPRQTRKKQEFPIDPASGKRIFPAGKSGNPAGRPKGTKNQITILREALELRLRDKASYKIEKVMDKAIEMALAGDRLMIKLLLEMHMSKASHTEDSTGGKSQVAVVIQNLTEPRSDKGTIIDVTPIENPKNE